MTVSSNFPIVTFLVQAPRFGTPGAAALFVGSDLNHDFFFFPLSRCAVVRTQEHEKLLTAFEEDAFGAAQYDFAQDLYELTTQGQVA